MTEKLFEAALRVGPLLYVASADLSALARTLTIHVVCVADIRSVAQAVGGEHPVYPAVTKSYRCLDFLHYQCLLEVRVRRVRLQDGAVRQVGPASAGVLSGFILLFEALVLILCQWMIFAAAARLVGESWHRFSAFRERYVELRFEQRKSLQRAK